MAARKGIKAKIIERLAAEPDRVWYGREIEAMYKEYGGSVLGANGTKYPKSRMGRVDPLTLQRLFGQLPLTRTAFGNVPRGRGGSHATNYIEAAWAYRAVMQKPRPPVTTALKSLAGQFAKNP